MYSDLHKRTKYLAGFILKRVHEIASKNVNTSIHLQGCLRLHCFQCHSFELSFSFLLTYVSPRCLRQCFWILQAIYISRFIFNLSERILVEFCFLRLSLGGAGLGFLYFQEQMYIHHNFDETAKLAPANSTNIDASPLGNLASLLKLPPSLRIIHLKNYVLAVSVYSLDR